MLLAKEISYQHSQRFQLQVPHLQLKQGEILSIIGPNGSGKSTLLRLLGRLWNPTSGQILLDGVPLSQWDGCEIAKRLAMLPQVHDHSIEWTVRELVEFGRHPHKTWYKRLSPEDERMVNWALEVTKMDTFQDRPLPALSGGERQRAWIAMTLAQSSSILLLDEPTTYLDISHQLEVMELVKRLNQELGLTVVMVLHDINQATLYSDRLVVMKNGQVHLDGSPEEVIQPSMFHDVFGIEVSIQHSDKPTFIPMRTCYDQRRK
ncbi:ABC transporter ATP-binding protein [Thermoactinomyces sp. DSM 45892]|uniref:ABC transporter ATP-binding protein n=1 Tax=Thermoactinomyces sp. DSM 45892 TaxID=1882753 RepID=UPI0008977C6E|nr:ABC transporter ATP-binding protein [Thermoactinomyces sp. DSM 45892]SDY12304.1 iron complex transport system ATP-binding protein [Thermoactinomyces sp. DSM 45892]